MATEAPLTATIELAIVPAPTFWLECRLAAKSASRRSDASGFGVEGRGRTGRLANA
jgi:hypothetical protein